MNKILKYFQSNLSALPNSYLLLSVSGGQDSIFLLFLLLVLKKQWHFKITSIYCQHLWQKESLLFVLHLLKIHYWIQTELIIPVTINNLKNEESARNWRYKQLERFYFLNQAQYVLTGHTNSDQLESFLFNLIRGCTGIATITNQRFDLSSKYLCFTDKKIEVFDIQLKSNSKYSIRIIRPLLCLNRYEIYQSMHLTHLPIWVDRTNYQMQYRRNRIRYELLPSMRFYFNNRCDLSFLKYIQILGEDLRFLDLLICQIIQTNVFYTKQTIIFNLSLFTFYPYGIKKRILVQSLALINWPSIHFDLIQTILKIVSLIQTKRNSFFFIYQNLVIGIYSNKFIIHRALRGQYGHRQGFADT